MLDWPAHATVYTQTVVHTAPERYVQEAPYEVAIIERQDRTRITVRVLSDSAGRRASVGDDVLFVEERDGVGYYRVSSQAR